MKTKQTIISLLFSALLICSASVIKAMDTATKPDSLTMQVKDLFLKEELSLFSLKDLNGAVNQSEDAELTNMIVSRAQLLVSSDGEKTLDSIQNAYVGLIVLEKFCAYKDSTNLKKQLLMCYGAKELISKIETLDISEAQAGSKLNLASRAFALLLQLDEPDDKEFLEKYLLILQTKNDELQKLYETELAKRNTIMDPFRKGTLTLAHVQAYHQNTKELGYKDRFSIICTEAIMVYTDHLLGLDQDQKKTITFSTLENACAGLWLLFRFENELGNDKFALDNRNKGIELIISFREDVINPLIDKAIDSPEKTEKEAGMRALTLIECFFNHPETTAWIARQRAAISKATDTDEKPALGSTESSHVTPKTTTVDKPKPKAPAATIHSSKTSWFTIKRLLLIGGGLTVAALVGFGAYTKYGKKKGAGAQPQPVK